MWNKPIIEIPLNGPNLPSDFDNGLQFFLSGFHVKFGEINLELTILYGPYLPSSFDDGLWLLLIVFI